MKNETIRSGLALSAFLVSLINIFFVIAFVVLTPDDTYRELADGMNEMFQEIEDGVYEEDGFEAFEAERWTYEGVKKGFTMLYVVSFIAAFLVSTLSFVAYYKNSKVFAIIAVVMAIMLHFNLPFAILQAISVPKMKECRKETEMLKNLDGRIKSY